MTEKEKLQAIEAHLTEVRRIEKNKYDFYIHRWEESKNVSNYDAAESWWNLAMGANEKIRQYSELAEAIHNIIH